MKLNLRPLFILNHFVRDTPIIKQREIAREKLQEQEKCFQEVGEQLTQLETHFDKKKLLRCLDNLIPFCFSQRIKALKSRIKKWQGEPADKIAFFLSETRKILRETQEKTPVDLEARLTEKRELMDEIRRLSETRQTEMIAFLRSCQSRNMLKILFDRENVLPAEEQEKEWKTVLDIFRKHNHELEYFSDSLLNNETFLNYLKEIYFAIRFISIILEGNEDPDMIVSNAYKILVLFLEIPETVSAADDETITTYLTQANLAHPLSSFEKYLRLHHNEDLNPVHDALVVYNIPPKIPSHARLQEWRALIQKLGPQVLKFFRSAHELQLPETEKLTYRNIQMPMYKRQAEAPEFATICYDQGVPEATFDACLPIIEKGSKTRDNLPDIMINGDETDDSTLHGYYFVKIPPGDPMALVAGYFVNCCQYVTNHAEQCAIDAFQLENNGIVLLLAKKQRTSAPLNPKKIDYSLFSIIGQGYLVRAISNNFYIDSYEGLRTAQDELAVKMMTRYAERVVDTSQGKTWRFCIGVGGNTPRALRHTQALAREILMEGEDYGDAAKQGVIVNRSPEKVDELPAELAPLRPFITSNLIYRFIKKNTEWFTKNLEPIMAEEKPFLFVCDFFAFLHFEVHFSIEECREFNLFLKMSTTGDPEKLYPNLSQLMPLTSLRYIKKLLTEEKNLDKILRVIAHPNALRCFRQGETNLFAPSLTTVIQTLTSKSIASAAEKVEAALSPNAIICYEQRIQNPHYPSFQDLTQHTSNVSHIELLISPDARNCYDRRKNSSRYPDFTDLLRHDYHSIQNLISPDAQFCYAKMGAYYSNDSNYPDFHDFQRVSGYAVRALARPEARACYDKAEKDSKHYPGFQVVMHYKGHVIEWLTSENAQICYERAQRSPHYPDFATLNTMHDRLHWYLRNDALACYEIAEERDFQLFSFMTLRTLNIGTRLISPEARRSYLTGYDGDVFPTIESLTQFAVDFQEVLLSKNAVNCYSEHAHNPHTPKYSDLINLIMTRPSVSIFGSTTKMQLDTKLRIISALISDEALICYRERHAGQPYPSFNQLRQIQYDSAIRTLTSDDARTCYDMAETEAHSAPTFDELRETKGDTNRRALINQTTLACYKRSKTDSRFPPYAILRLARNNSCLEVALSETALQLYECSLVTFTDLLTHFNDLLIPGSPLNSFFEPTGECINELSKMHDFQSTFLKLCRMIPPATHYRRIELLRQLSIIIRLNRDLTSELIFGDAYPEFSTAFFTLVRHLDYHSLDKFLRTSGIIRQTILSRAPVSESDKLDLANGDSQKYNNLSRTFTRIDAMSHISWFKYSSLTRHHMNGAFEKIKGQFYFHSRSILQTLRTLFSFIARDFFWNEGSRSTALYQAGQIITKALYRSPDKRLHPEILAMMICLRELPEVPTLESLLLQSESKLDRQLFSTIQKRIKKEPEKYSLDRLKAHLLSMIYFPYFESLFEYVLARELREMNIRSNVTLLMGVETNTEVEPREGYEDDDYEEEEENDEDEAEKPKITEIVLNPSIRDKFFDRFPRLQQLLLREEMNPIVNTSESARDGEFYLAHEAVALYAYRKWGRNILVIDKTKSPKHRLHDAVRAIIQAKRPASHIIYIFGIHAITISIFYSREKNQFATIILDSEQEPIEDTHDSEHLSLLSSLLPTASLIFYLPTKAQRDYYSCATFALVAAEAVIDGFYDKREHNPFNLGGTSAKAITKGLNPFDLADTGSEAAAASKTVAIPLRQNDCPREYQQLFQPIPRIFHERYLDVIDVDISNLLFLQNHTYNVAALMAKYRILLELGHYLNSEPFAHCEIDLDPDSDLPEPMQAVVDVMADVNTFLEPEQTPTSLPTRVIGNLTCAPCHV